MLKHSLSHFIIILTLQEVFVKTHLTVHDSGHGFVSNNHERYFAEDISSFHEELTSTVRSSSISDLNMKLLLKFDPELLDFQQRPLGVPHLEKVTLFNVDSNKSIDMTSISGSTVHFHSSFFEDKRIPPLGNTSFNVVFLGREEGSIESNLFIHTTEGHFKYQVKGASTSSPYRLRPIVGIKLPLNTTFSPLIHMYNPYTEPIQIVEIYSSSGDFHLELPTGALEGPKNMWEIPPLQTKAVIRVRFNAQTEQNHTAYVRIKLNNTEDILVVPLEVEVTSSAGLYVPQGSVDFGVGGSMDPPKQISLFVSNPLKKDVKIHSVSSTSAAIKIDYENVKVPADFKNSKGTEPTKIAVLTLNWKPAYGNKDFSGKIIIKYKNGKSKTEIPYYLTVLEGGLSFNSSLASYFINESPKQILRDINIKNNFLIPVALMNVTLQEDAQNYFNILNFKPIIVQPQEKTTIFTLNLKTDVPLFNIKINSYITLKTNISMVRFPLLSYNGKLQVSFPYVSKDNTLDLGLLSLDAKKDAHFLLLNTNPIPIKFNQIKTSLPASSIEVLSCGKGNHAEALLNLSYNMTKCDNLNPHEFAIVRLSIHSPHAEGQVWGDVVVETKYEKLSIPVHFKVAQGKLEIGPDRLVFDQCFPGKICSHPIRVHSTFNDPMVIEDITSMPPDPRLSCQHLGHIMARSTKVIGHLYLDPTLECINKCYLGLNLDNAARWIKTLMLPVLTPEFDLSLVNVLYNRYLNKTSNGLKKWQNLTMRLDTSEVKWHIFKTRVKMSWPSLVVKENSGNGTIVKFPLTQVGNSSYYNLTVRNPSSHNLIVQLVLNTVYPKFDTLNDGLPPNFIPGYTNEEHFNKSNAFFFDQDHKFYHNNFKRKINLIAHDLSLPILLAPGENQTITIGYRAVAAIRSSGFLYIRNNLTTIEVVQLIGQGAIPNFKFGNRKPGSVQPLAFELTEKHLKDCEHKKHPTPNLTVKRTFTARNMGEVTIHISGFFINNLPCEGYGFKILNCDPFVLLPNSTRKIDIAFTPDFTLAKIVRTLSLDTSLNVPVNYTLITTVPPNYLLPCSMAIGRPIWEPYLYYMMLSSMCVLLLFVTAMIIIEAEHTLKEAVVFVSRSSPTTQPTLDLRLVGSQIKSEIQSSKNEENVPSKEKVKCSETNIANSTDDPNKSFKQEGDKYTAIIPTVGKSKKKLSKKNSNESNLPENMHELPKKCCLDVPKQKTKNIGAEHEHKKTNDVCKDKKAAAVHLKKNLKNDVEEETSSTTTESSNNDEIDNRENEKAVKTQGKKSPVVKNVYVAVGSKNHAENAKEAFIKPDFKKTLRKLVPKNKERDVHENKEVKTVTEHKAKGFKTFIKERKDRQPLIKKLSVEKKQQTDGQAGTSSNVRMSPTLQQFNNIWSENRATFSDVVARSDNAPTSTAIPTRPLMIQSQNQMGKPTMYVEPYKQTTTDLGPIGSRKTDYNQLSNSFFSDNHHSLTLENSNTFLNYDENWEQRSNTSQLMNLMQPNVGCPTTISDPWNHQNSNITGYWDTSPSRNIMNDTYQTSQVNQDSSYLWGSSSVWQPWAPSEMSRTPLEIQRTPTEIPRSPLEMPRISSDLPRSPTRTPPGFTSNREMEERIQQNQVYDLFGMTNIWAQQYPNPWNYPQGQ